MSLDFIEVIHEPLSYLDFFGIVKFILAVFFWLYVKGDKTRLFDISEMCYQKRPMVGERSADHTIFRDSFSSNFEDQE